MKRSWRLPGERSNATDLPPGRRARSHRGSRSSTKGRVQGLGARFLREFDAAITEIQEAPTRWRILEEDVRRFVMNRFPYGIYYRVEGENLRVLVVKHHSRHPDYWKYRLA